ncbi:MAG: PhzF family phenazine biosynthesis protein [Acidobacteria bacterium]|nr:PhzF family phenazine biosynthesis protein [Acidobacteriota bacterium]
MQMYQIDAFSDRVFGGNPAAVVPLETWLPDDVMQAIAVENNLAETAFFAPEGNDFRLRWFTPVAEVDLCGHATMASADVLFRILGYQRGTARFHTRSGVLTVECQDGMYAMDFPASMPTACAAAPGLLESLGVQSGVTLKAFDYVVVLDTEAAVRALAPDFNCMATLDLRGVVVTAPGDDADYVARCFYPKLGVNEDPVTGSAHCEAAPYWAERIGKTDLQARQLSARGGTIWCSVRGARVILRGRAAHFMTAEITVPPAR